MAKEKASVKELLNFIKKNDKNNEAFDYRYRGARYYKEAVYRGNETKIDDTRYTWHMRRTIIHLGMMFHDIFGVSELKSAHKLSNDFILTSVSNRVLGQLY